MPLTRELSACTIKTFKSHVTFFFFVRPMGEEVRKLESFEEVFSRYFGRVYRFILSLTRSTDLAEEITQQTFFRALEKIDSFEGRSDVGTWLCSIAKNEFFSRSRRKEHPVAPDSLVFERSGEDVAEGVQRDQQRMQIHRHLHGLEEPYREVFMLRVFGELKYSQIAALFGKSESWARVTYYRAKVEIQNRIMEEEK